MILKSLKYLSLLFLTGCFYGKVQLTSSDETLIPYHKSFQLIFKNTFNSTDTLNFIKQLISPSNLDFLMSKHLSEQNPKKRPFVLKYSTDIAVNRIIDKKLDAQSRIIYDPITFLFIKDEKDQTLTLFYNIDNHWDGKISFDTINTSALVVNGASLNDVFSINNTTQKSSSIDKLYWSLQYGLVRIDEKNGNRWNLLINRN